MGALIRGAGEGADQLVASVAHRLVQLGRQHELSLDASASVGQLANIAWTSGSTAKHSPEVAAEAIDGLRDLLRRWSVEVPRASGTSGLPVAYRDDDCQNVVDAMLAMLAVSRESQQQQTAARVLDAFARTLPGLQEPERQRIAGGLREAADMIAEGAWTPTLRAAAATCGAALASLGLAETADALRSAFEQER